MSTTVGPHNPDHVRVPGKDLPRTPRRRTGGRSARVRADVLRAVLDILLNNGVDNLSIAQVAQRAGVHESSIYRRWGSKASLLIDAVLSRLERQIPKPETGNLRGDLLELFGKIADFLASPLGQALLRLSARHDLPEYEAARNLIWTERLSVGSAVLRQAEARGELRHGIDHRIALEALVGLLTHRIIMTREPVDGTVVDKVVELLLIGIASNTNTEWQILRR
jgi:AcrR family transcriptional regulator